MYITVKPPYNEVLGLTNYLFLTPVIVEYKAQYEKKNRYKLTSLVITKIFCQSLGPLLYPGCTVLNFIYLFFKKWGGGVVLSPPSPSPCAGPVQYVPWKYWQKKLLSLCPLQYHGFVGSVFHWTGKYFLRISLNIFLFGGMAEYTEYSKIRNIRNTLKHGIYRIFCIWFELDWQKQRQRILGCFEIFKIQFWHCRKYTIDLMTVLIFIKRLF